MDVRDYIAANAADFSRALREYVDLSRLLPGAESVAYVREELADGGAVRQ